LALACAACLLVLFLLAVLGAGLAVRFVLGIEYRDALEPTVLMLCGAFAQSLGGVSGVFLIARKREVWLLIAHAVAAGLYVVGCWYLVPEMGARGAALLAAGAGVFTAALLTGRLCLRPRPILAAPAPADAIRAV